MDLERVARGEPWMSSGARRAVREYAGAMRVHLEACGVADAPPLALRLHDVTCSLAQALMLDARLKDAEAGPPLFDAAGKARERLRRAMKELEEYCAKAGTPVDQGVADAVRPLMLQGQGVVEEVLGVREGLRNGAASGSMAACDATSGMESSD